jgi:hypothetical protein
MEALFLDLFFPSSFEHCYIEFILNFERGSMNQTLLHQKVL